jgi:type II secretory pathway component PulC
VRAVGANATCGLEPDDILVSVNGISVTDQRSLSANRERLRSADEFELAVERNRKLMRLHYQVKE